MNQGAIVEHFRPAPSVRLCRDVERLALALRRERSELVLPDSFRDLAPKQLEDGPTLHLVDVSEIMRLDGGIDVRFYQDRARLRAGDNDLVASCADRVAGHESYCRDFLGLGAPGWLRPHEGRDPRKVAEACWKDRKVRRLLIDKLRSGRLAYIHPNMGTLSVWELGLLLRSETHRPIKIVAPPPDVQRWVNDKVAFTATVVRLFGPELAPRTRSACNYAVSTQRAKDLAERSAMLGFKLPLAAGGDGNVVVNADRIRNHTLPEVCQLLKHQLRPLQWDGCSPLLIDRWETDVLGSPAAQLWIPPVAQGPPLVEGIFSQTTEKLHGVFVGASRALLPSGLIQEITDRTWLLARLFQLLGYVGRCSFDMILVGSSLSNARLKFIECNGRWGGTSLYMTLMNRIFGDWIRQPFAVHAAHRIPGLDRFTLVDMFDCFRGELFDARTGKGSLILANPGRLPYVSGITAISLATSWQDAAVNVRKIPERLTHFVQRNRKMDTTSGNREVSTDYEL